MSQKILFVDDRSRRIHAALKRWGDDVTIAPNVKEALRLLSSQEWDIVSLDADLGGDDFVDPDSKDSAMEIIRYLEKTDEEHSIHHRLAHSPFIIHSTNIFVALFMQYRIRKLGFDADIQPFKFDAGEYRNGVIAGAFDVIHPGYILLFMDAKKVCDQLFIAIHIDPSVERPEKQKPVLPGSL